MPKITQYNAPIGNLSESTRGDAAFEQAGRRLGPLYNEAAKFQEQQGAITAGEYKQLTWPRDMLKLYEAQAAGKAGTGGGGRGRTPYSDLRNMLPPEERMPDYGATGQMSRGAGVLGRALSDGGYALANPAGEDMTLVEGRLVPLSAAREAQQRLNNSIDKENSEELERLVNTREYWERYNGVPKNASDTSGFSTSGASPLYPEQYGDPYAQAKQMNAANPNAGTFTVDETNYASLADTSGNPSWLSGLRNWNNATTPDTSTGY